MSTDIDIEESKYFLQLQDLFDGKISLTEIDEMDIPRLTSLIESKIQLINERDEAMKKSLQEKK